MQPFSLLPIIWFGSEVGCVTNKNIRKKKKKRINVKPNIVNIFRIYFELHGSFVEEGNCSFRLKIYISFSNILGISFLSLVQCIGWALEQIAMSFCSQKIHFLFHFILATAQIRMYIVFFLHITTKISRKKRLQVFEIATFSPLKNVRSFEWHTSHTCTNTFSSVRCNFYMYKTSKNVLSNGQNAMLTNSEHLFRLFWVITSAFVFRSRIWCASFLVLNIRY